MLYSGPTSETRFRGWCVGGFVGFLKKNGSNPCKVLHCSVHGDITGSGSVGGFCGDDDSPDESWDCEISHCSASGTAHSDYESIGGFMGYSNGDFIRLTNNTTSMTVTADINASMSYRFVGGFVSRAYGGTFERCSASGNVTVSTDAGVVVPVGGFAGEIIAKSGMTCTITQCASSGNVSASVRGVGGFIGQVNGNSGTLTVTDCCATGNVAAPGKCWAGGFVGTKGNIEVTDDNPSTGSTCSASFTNCFSSGTVSGGFGLGGFWGFANTSCTNISLTRCMAFNSSLNATGYGSGNYGSGAVAGCIRSAIVVNECYRKKGYSFTTSPWARGALTDHDFITPAAVIPNRGDGGTNSQYHDGHESTYDTLTELVTRGTIGGDWDSAIWDLSGNTPHLRWLGNLQGYYNHNGGAVDWGH